MEILHEFTNWITKNYSHTKGGYRHRGDFYKNDKPMNLQALKDLFINEKHSVSNLVELKQTDVVRSVCCNSELVNFNKDYNQCFVCKKIQNKQTDA